MLIKSIFFNRYEKTIKCSVSYFLKHNLDAFYLATNAPGRSAFNRVKRRMAPLSNDLAGVGLPHDTFGSHLNNKNETVDKELEMKNFAKAGEVLAEIWSKTVIDIYPTVAEYINPSNEVFIIIIIIIIISLLKIPLAATIKLNYRYTTLLSYIII